MFVVVGTLAFFHKLNNHLAACALYPVKEALPAPQFHFK
jgi:hypothetical protein